MATTAQISAIQQLYIAYFNRPADAAGLDFWAKQVTNGASLDVISATFAATPEYKALFAGMSSDQIVNQIYQNLFNRAPDAAGLKFWSDKLTDKALTVDNVVAAVAASAQQDPAKGPDTVAIQSKVAAAVAFTDFLNTDVESRIAYSSGSVNAVGVNYIHSVIDTTTLAAAKTSLPTTIQTALETGNQTPGNTYTLTVTPDTLVGTAGNDAFVANTNATGDQTLTSLDSIDGSGGNDTLSVVSVGTLDTTGVAATIKNVETISLVSTADVITDSTEWTGATQLNVTAVGEATVTAAATTNVTTTVGKAAGNTITVDGGKDVTIAATGVTTAGTINVGQTTAVKGAVNVTVTELATATTNTADAINVKGGTAVTITANLKGAVNNTITGGAIGVTGTADTTTVTVTQTAAATAAADKSGVVDGAVTIADANAGSTTKAATIASVTLANYGNSTISSNALTNLSLSGKSGTLGITSGLTKETVTTLNLTVNGLTGTNTITDVSNHFKTLNITTAGADSVIAGFADTAATALTVTGEKALDLTATGLTNLATVTVSGAAGLTTDVSTLAKLTTVNASASTGANNVILDGTVTAYTGGSGVDTVTIVADATKAIDGGAGTADELVLNANATAFTTAIADNAKVTGFEILGTGAASEGAFDATGFTGLHVAGTVANAVSFINVAAGTTLAVDAAPGADITYTLKTNTAADAATLSIGTADADGVDLSGNAINLTSVESVTLNSLGSNEDGTFTNKVQIVDATASSLTITGTESVVVTGFGSSTLKTIDASAVGADLTVDLTGVTLAAAGVSFKGGAGNYLLTDTNLAAGKTLTYTAGDGDNTIVLSSATTGKAAITLGNGDNSITLTGSTGASTINAGSGENTIVLGTGASIVTLAVDTDDADTVTVGVPATANNYATITGLSTDDVLKFAAVGTEIWSGTGGTATSAKIVLDTSTALFADYVTAASALGAGTNGTFSWFQFQGNTYVVEDNDAAAGFQAGTDLIVKLTGLVDLSEATLDGTAHTITLA